MNQIETAPAPDTANERPARSNFAPLLRFEWTKLVGRRLTWVPFLMLALIVTLIMIVAHRIEFTVQRRIFASFNLTFKAKEFVNGYYITIYTMNPIFNMLMPIFIAVASGMMVAGESEHGTLRACLIRPVTRSRLLLSKFIILAGYCLALSGFVLLLLVGTGILNFGTGDLYAMNGIFNNGHFGASMIPAGEVPFRLFLAGLIATFGMTVLAALALLISALVETAAMSYVVTLSIYFAVLTLRAFPFLDWLYPYLFTTHMLRWQQCFSSTIKTDEIYISLANLAGYLVVLLTTAVVLFERRDIKS